MEQMPRVRCEKDHKSPTENICGAKGRGAVPPLIAVSLGVIHLLPSGTCRMAGDPGGRTDRQQSPNRCETRALGNGGAATYTEEFGKGCADRGADCRGHQGGQGAEGCWAASGPRHERQFQPRPPGASLTARRPWRRSSRRSFNRSGDRCRRLSARGFNGCAS